MKTVPASPTDDPVIETLATPSQAIDALHMALATTREHGQCMPGALAGCFKPAHKAKSLTTAPHLQGETIPITVRFPDFTGVPTMANTAGSSRPRGLAIKFHLPDGSTTDIVSHSFNGFPVATTDELRSLMLAIGASSHVVEKPTALDRFLAYHPAAKTFLTTQKPFRYATPP